MPLSKMFDTDAVVRTAQDYWSLPEGMRAELVDGKLYDMAPPSYTHQMVAGGITQRLRNHVDAHGGPCKVIPAPFAVNLFADDNTYLEPDVSVVCDPSKLSERGCEGAPDLVVEVVSPSSRTMDYFTKAERYERAGVREYWIVDPASRQTVVYRYDSEKHLVSLYPFDTPVPVGIWDGSASIRIDELL